MSNLKISLSQMFSELENASSLYQPSLFWRKLNKVHISQLETAGVENIKRSVNMRYFNWGILGILAHQLTPIFEGIRKFNFKPFLGSKLIKGNSLKGVRQFKGLNQYIYSVYVAYLFEFVRKVDRLNIFNQIQEPKFGNPFIISYAGFKISQDLCNSTFEFYSIIDNIKLTKNLKIAELGAGYGRTAFVFLKILKDCSYCVIDIPPALFISQSYLSKVFPKEKFFLFRPFSKYSEIKSEFESAKIKFLMPHQIELLPDGAFDLFVNISSLHEMTFAQIKNYLKQMDRLSMGYVFSKQWLKSMTEDNNYIRVNQYPIPKKWQTVVLGKHPVQKMFFEALYKVK